MLARKRLRGHPVREVGHLDGLRGGCGRGKLGLLVGAGKEVAHGARPGGEFLGGLRGFHFYNLGLHLADFHLENVQRAVEVAVGGHQGHIGRGGEKADVQHR